MRMALPPRPLVWHRHTYKPFTRLLSDMLKSSIHVSGSALPITLAQVLRLAFKNFVHSKLALNQTQQGDTPDIHRMLKGVLLRRRLRSFFRNEPDEGASMVDVIAV